MKQLVFFPLAALLTAASLQAQVPPPAPPPVPAAVPVPSPGAVLETIRNIQIEIKGPQSITVQEVQALLKLKINETYDPATADQDRDALWDTGKVSAVDISPQHGPSGFTALVSIIGRGKLASIEVKGNTRISAENVLKDRTLQKGDEFGWAELKQMLNEVLALYHRAGFPEAKVNGSMFPVPGGSQGSITITVEEGPRELIRDIRFTGLSEDVGANELGTVMQQKPSRARLPTEALEEDFQAISRALKNRGYAKAKVASWNRAATDETEVYDMNIVLEQGVRYSVKGVFVKGYNAVPLNVLDPLIRLRPGAIYSLEGEENDAKAMDQYYYDIGYMDAVISQTAEDASATELNLHYDIREGPRYKLDSIRILGRYNTHEKVLWKEFEETGVRPGDFVSLPRLKAMEAHFKNLTYLEKASFRILSGEASSAENPVKDILIELEEKVPGNIQFGGGFLSSTVYAHLKLENLNFDFYDDEFYGAGQDFKLEIKLQTNGGMLDMSLGDRDFFGQTLRLQLPDLVAEEKARALKTAPEEAAAQ